jgi:BirA family biotin operon repressor/biotin-[acetyl-CoA-carboxylase] ligase
MTIQLPDGYDLINLDEIDSTNEHARRLIGQGLSGPTWICARSQTAGRGRQGHSWISDTGNLFCTLALAVDRAPAEAANLSFVAALAIARFLENYVDTSLIGLKWPNDVLIEEQKVSGILLEAQDKDSVLWVAIGIGINLAEAPKDLPYPAVALSDMTSKAPDFEGAMAALAVAFHHWLDIWREEGFDPIRRAWLDTAVRLNTEIQVRLPQETITGIFESINEKGELVLVLSDNKKRIISAGEVYFDPTKSE